MNYLLRLFFFILFFSNSCSTEKTFKKLPVITIGIIITSFVSYKILSSLFRKNISNNPNPNLKETTPEQNNHPALSKHPKSTSRNNNENVFFLRLKFINNILDKKSENNDLMGDEIKFLNLTKNIILKMKNEFNSTDLNQQTHLEELTKYDKDLLKVDNFCTECKTNHFTFNKKDTATPNDTTTYKDTITNNNPEKTHYIIQVAGREDLTMGGAQDGATRNNIRKNITYPTVINKELYKLSEINYKDKIDESFIMVHLNAENTKDEKVGISYIVNLALNNNSNKEIEKYMLEKQYKSFFILSAIIQKLDSNQKKNINIIPTSLGAGVFNNNHSNIESAFNESKNKFSHLLKNSQNQPTLTFYFYDKNSVIKPCP